MGTDVRYVLVPQHDIDKLEKARNYLHAMFPNHPQSLALQLQFISAPMWQITHRKYQKSEENTNIKAKVKATIHGKPCGDYTASLHKKGSKTVLRITPCEGTGGHWQWDLSTLMLDGEASDVLALDLGQAWMVTGMIAVYEEILNENLQGMD